MGLFHDWEYFDNVQLDTFLGESFEVASKEFRRCVKTGIVQEYKNPFWATLSRAKTEIFNKTRGKSKPTRPSKRSRKVKAPTSKEELGASPDFQDWLNWFVLPDGQTLDDISDHIPYMEMVWTVLMREVKPKKESGPDAMELVQAVANCESERHQAQMSGLETGWENPTTQTMWKKILEVAARVQKAKYGNYKGVI